MGNEKHNSLKTLSDFPVSFHSGKLFIYFRARKWNYCMAIVGRKHVHKFEPYLRDNFEAIFYAD